MWTDAARERYKDDGRRYPSDLTDAEWHTIEPVLRSYATLTVNLREMINACLYLEKAGCPWRFLPKEFDPWQTVRTWHDRFRADGIWSDIAALLTRPWSRGQCVRSRGGSLSRRRPSRRNRLVCAWTARAFHPGRRRDRAASTATRRCGASSATC